MTPSAILLITISACAHAFWNFLSKRRAPSPAFFLIATLAAMLITFPALWLFRQGLPFFTLIDWALVAVTGLFQAIYYIGLAGAYSNGDLSLAYPLARSLPVLLVALASVLLGRGTQIGPWAFVGFIAVALGCLILPLPRLSDLRLAHYLNMCCIYAIIAAICTTGYTLVDDQVLRNLRSAPGISLSNTPVTILFLACENISQAFFLGLYVLLKPSERIGLAQKWRHLARPASLTGLVITGAYGLVLLAMASANNVSYISAFRQLSLPIGVFLGMTLGREPRYPSRLLGLAVVFTGLVLVAAG